MPHTYLTIADAIFTVSSAVGLWYSVAVLPSYYRSWRESRHISDTENRRLARRLHFEIFITESMRTLIHLLFLVAGAWTVFVPPIPTPPQTIAQGVLQLYVLIAIVSGNILITVNTLVIRSGYRVRRRERLTKPLPTRQTMAAVLRRLHNVEHKAAHTDARVTAEERRNVGIEERAETAHARADVAEADLGDHGERLTVVEEVVEIRHSTTKKGEPPA